MSVTESVLFNMGCGLVSSFVFLFVVLVLFKPSIKIADIICKNDNQFKDDPQLYYFFKIVNRSIFSAYDLRVELNVIERYPTPPSGMMNKRTIPLTLVLSYVSHLPAYRPGWWRKDAEHCMRFRTIDNLDNIVDDPHKSVQLQITLRHGLTGLVKVFYQDYADVSLIKTGKFSYGTKIGYIPTNT
jgi:hypothetical protein